MKNAPVKFFWLGLLSAFACLNTAIGQNPDSISDTLEQNLGFAFGSDDQGFLQFGGQVDVWLFTTRNGGPTGFFFPAPGRRSDIASRATMNIDGFWSDFLYGFIKFRWDDGVHPGVSRFYGDSNQFRWDEYFLRWQGEAGRWNFQVGRFTPTFGNFLGRHDAWDNPFVNYPLTYENVTSVSDIIVAPDAQAFADRRLLSDAKLDWVSPIWAPLYVKAASVFGVINRWEYALTVANGAPSSRGITWDNNRWSDPTVYLHLGYRASAALTYGIMASHGSYMQIEARPQLPAGTDIGDFPQETLGLWGNYARGKFQWFGAWLWNSHKVPNVGYVRMHSAYVEGRYQISTKWFAAARWNHQLYESIKDSNGNRLSWDNDLYRIDLSLGWRPYRSLQIKAGYSLKQERGPLKNGEQLWVLETSWRF